LFLEYEGVLDLQIQNTTRPADPEEATSNSIPKPAPEHPIGHTTFQHKRIQPGTPPILSVFQFFSDSF
jgi:hypothetical protein